MVCSLNFSHYDEVNLQSFVFLQGPQDLSAAAAAALVDGGLQHLFKGTADQNLSTKVGPLITYTLVRLNIR